MVFKKRGLLRALVVGGTIAVCLALNSGNVLAAEYESDTEKELEVVAESGTGLESDQHDKVSLEEMEETVEAVEEDAVKEEGYRDEIKEAVDNKTLTPYSESLIDKKAEGTLVDAKDKTEFVKEEDKKVKEETEEARAGFEEATTAADEAGYCDSEEIKNALDSSETNEEKIGVVDGVVSDTEEKLTEIGADELAHYEELKNQYEELLAEYFAAKEQYQKVIDEINDYDEKANSAWENYAKYKALIDEAEAALSEFEGLDEEIESIKREMEAVNEEIIIARDEEEKLKELINAIEAEIQRLYAKMELTNQYIDENVSEHEALLNDSERLNYIEETIRKEMAVLEEIIHQYYREHTDITREFQEILDRFAVLCELQRQAQQQISTTNDLVAANEKKYYELTSTNEQTAGSLQINNESLAGKQADISTIIENRNKLENHYKELEERLAGYNEPLSRRQQWKEKKDTYVNSANVYGEEYLKYITEKHNLQVAGIPSEVVSAYESLYTTNYYSIKEYEDILKKIDQYKDVLGDINILEQLKNAALNYKAALEKENEAKVLVGRSETALSRVFNAYEEMQQLIKDYYKIKPIEEIVEEQKKAFEKAAEEAGVAEYAKRATEASTNEEKVEIIEKAEEELKSTKEKVDRVVGEIESIEAEINKAKEEMAEAEKVMEETKWVFDGLNKRDEAQQQYEKELEWYEKNKQELPGKENERKVAEDSRNALYDIYCGCKEAYENAVKEVERLNEELDKLIKQYKDEIDGYNAEKKRLEEELKSCTDESRRLQIEGIIDGLDQMIGSTQADIWLREFEKSENWESIEMIDYAYYDSEHIYKQAEDELTEINNRIDYLKQEISRFEKLEPELLEIINFDYESVLSQYETAYYNYWRAMDICTYRSRDLIGIDVDYYKSKKIVLDYFFEASESYKYALRAETTKAQNNAAEISDKVTDIIKNVTAVVKANVDVSESNATKFFENVDKLITFITNNFSWALNWLGGLFA